MRQRILVALFSLLLAATVSAQVTVVNSASFRPNQPLAAGSIASAFGTFLGVTATSATYQCIELVVDTFLRVTELGAGERH